MVSIMSDTRWGRTPWHFWVVGVIALLWNSYGPFDYTMTQTGGDGYLRSVGMTEPMIAYFHAMPAWMTGVWAIGVWGALLGSILMLARRRLAFPVFVVSLAAFVVSLIYSYGLSNGAAVMGDTAWIMNAVILAGCLFLVWYSRAMAARGFLR
jgi:hypothetical protein